MRGINVISLAIAASLTTSGNGEATDVSNFSGEGRLTFSASATGAADNTLDVKIQDSADGMTDWQDTGVAFDQVGNADASHQVKGVNVDRFRRYIRVVDTLAGTTPAVVRSVDLIAKADS